VKNRYLLLICTVLCCSCSGLLRANEPTEPLEKIASAKAKPFVIIQNRGQGVVISGIDGYVLTAGHVVYDKDKKVYDAEPVISFRKPELKPWPNMFSSHKITFTDVEHGDFFEESYKSKVIKDGEDFFINRKDLALLKVATSGDLPSVSFYSKGKPKIKVGERLYLCHYVFPDQKGHPLFLVSPIEVLGMSDTQTGIQYFAQGFFRWGSSGSAILKDGKLIGIQSRGYTLNAEANVKTTLGHIAFEVVYEELIEGLMK